MSGTCVPWDVPRRDTGLSRPGDPVSPHFCPLNLNPGPVIRPGAGGVHACTYSPQWWALSGGGAVEGGARGGGRDGTSRSAMDCTVCPS